MKSLSLNSGRYSFSTLLTVSIVALLFCALLADYYLGKTFATALSAGFYTILFCVYMVLTKKLIFPKIVSMLFLGFLVWSIFTTLFSADITRSMWEDIRLITFFLLFILIYNVVSTYKTSGLFVKTFVYIGSFLVIYELSSHLIAGGFQNQVYLSGLFSWHNQSAGFLLFLIPLISSGILTIKKGLYRFVLVIFLLLSLSAMIVTYSRGGWIILLFQLLLSLGLLGKVTKKYVLLFFVGLFVLFSLAMYLQPSLFQKMVSIPREFTSERTVSGHFRVSAWATGIEIVKHFPIVGVGPDAFGSVYASFQNVPWLYARNAHNHLLQIASETGIVGLTLFMSFLTSIALILKTSFSKITPDKRVIVTGMLMAVIGSFLHSLIDYDYSTIVLFLLFALFLGAILGMVPVKTYALSLIGRNQILYIYLVLFLLVVGVLEISEDAYVDARYRYSEGRLEAAKQSLSKALRFNPYHGNAYVLASEIFYSAKEYDKAKQFANATTHLLPYENRQYSVLGAIAASENNYQDAIKWYAKAIQVRPYADPNQYQGLAYSYEQSGDVEKAAETLHHAKQDIFPLNQTYKGFEYIYFANGLTNDLASLYIILGKIYLKQGKTEEAEKLFQTVKKELTVPKSALQLKPTDMLE